MSVDNIVIPSGILTAWDGPQLLKDGNAASESEAFDVTRVARQRARTLSVSLDGRDHGRETRLDRLASVIRLLDDNQRSLQRSLDDKPGHNGPVQLPQRPTTINLGGLGRSRITGLGTPANPGLRLDRTSTTFSTRARAVRGVRYSDTREFDNSYVFQSLEKAQLPGQQAGRKPSRPSVFLARNSSNRRNTLRRGSSRKQSGRSQSNTSEFTLNIVRRASVAVENVVEKAKETVANAFRRSSLQEVYEKAKIRQVQLQRSTLAQRTFEYTYYLILVAIVYFVFVGVPFWSGLVLTIYYLFDMYLLIPAGTAIFLGIGFLYAYLPLLITFEKEPPQAMPTDALWQAESGAADDTALLIPCYKSEALIAATLEAALKVFPARNIFVIANGNSPTPLDNTAAVCERYGVSHTWSPIGSKIVAQFVGCYVAKQFPYALLIDDDCLLPPNFPIVTDRIRGNVLCIGYTIKSVGPNGSRGTLCQQAQDIEYKISGIQRAFAGKIGSATFPHGAISIWDRECLINTFQAHPGFSVSEDWFFGHVARQLGCRIQMCTAVFVETETPSAVFFSSGGARGGFGEMTIWKQRFFRWNYFFVSGLYWDMFYIIRNWNLGWWEIGAKLFVFQEVYETLLYLLAPFVLPISFYVRPEFSGYLYAATLALYQINVMIFNYVHLRARHESVTFLCLMYYLPYKIVLTFVNIASCYYSIYKYAKYFAKRHPKVIEDEKAVAVVLRLEEESYSNAAPIADTGARQSIESVSRARRFTVMAVGTTLSSVAQEPRLDAAAAAIAVVDFANPFPAITGTGALDEVREPFTKPRRAPPPIPPARRPYSWQRTTSDESSGSNISPFDERKRPRFPRPLSKWGRTTSKESSGSNISPFDERKIPKFPTPPAQAIIAERPVHEEEEEEEEPAVPERQASPTLFRRSIPLHSLWRSSSNRGPSVRRPSGAPLPRMTPPPPASLMEQRTTQPPSFSRLLCRSRSEESDLIHNIPTTPPPPSPPPPAMIMPPLSPQSRHIVVVSSSRDVGGGWPLPEVQPDGSRYILALADTGNQEARSARGGRREWLVIDEDDEEEEEEEEGSAARVSDVTLWDGAVGRGI